MSKRIDTALLAQAWLHSHEEDTPTTTVYRPAHFPFPPSRGRKGFELKPGGALVARKPGPTDQTQTTAGAWKLSDQKLELTPESGTPQLLHIESVEPDRLVIAKTPACKTS